MSEPAPGPGRPRIWLSMLRELGEEGQPARSEGLDFIEATDPAQFLEAGWAELLLVSDFLLRVLLQAERDPGFVRSWVDHTGAAGDAELMLLEKAREVSFRWLQRLDDVAAHHQERGTEPCSRATLPGSLFLAEAPLTYLLQDRDREGMEAGFEMLRDLTRVSVAHAAMATARALVGPGGELSRMSADEAALRLHTVAEQVLTTGAYAPSALYGLDPGALDTVERFCDEVLGRYGEELAESLRSRKGGLATDREIVVVDVQLACDVCALRTVTALRRAWDSGRAEDRAEWLRWRSEGRRILEDTPRSVTGVGHLDLSGARSWFQPDFGAGWPSCVADAEEIARSYLTGMTARSSWVGGGAGELVDIATRTHVMRFRIPRAGPQPWRSMPTLDAAFEKDPLLTWLLFPSVAPSSVGAFWRDSVYGGFFSAMDGLVPGDGDPAGVVSRRMARLPEELASRNPPVGFVRGLCPDLTPGAFRATAAMAGPLVARWLVRGRAEPPGERREVG